jgi:TonB family protein
MTAALIYRSAPRWRTPVSLLFATLFHVAAVVVAERRSGGATAADVSSELADIIVEPEVSASAPPDAVEDPALAMPSPPPAVETFADEPPALRRRYVAAAQTLVRRTAPGSTRPSSITSARVMAVSAPRPEYPYEARRQRLTGSGVAMLTVDFASGNVLDVVMLQSTGSAVLDNATVSAFRRWHFKPGTVSKVQTPITFTLAGASY